MKKSLLIVLILLIMITPVFAQGSKVPGYVETETIEFKDSLNRSVMVPKDITRISPSGPLAQIVLYTLVPDKLASWSKTPSDKVLSFIPEFIKDLPESGQLYGKNTNMNKEALINSDTQVIIDIGEVKKNMKEDLDKLSTEVGLPTVFIEARLSNMAQTYRTLGKLLNVEEKAEKLALYCEKVINIANSTNIENPVSLYVAIGKDGLKTTPEKSFHSEVLDIVKVNNVVKTKKAKGYITISQEELVNLNPQVIISNEELVDLEKNTVFSSLQAFKDKKVYHIPQLPFNWYAFPPSVNRIIGILWLGNICYPEQYNIDIKKEAKEFYSLFYHYELKDEELDNLLK